MSIMIAKTAMATLASVTAQERARRHAEEAKRRAMKVKSTADTKRRKV